MSWSNNEFAFGSILTASKMGLMQDNHTALAQGLSGAPKFQTAALNQVSGAEAVTTATMRAGCFTLGKFVNYAAGDYFLHAQSGCTAVTDRVKVAEVTLQRGGTLRVHMHIYFGDSPTTPYVYGLIYKNGADTGLWHYSSGTIYETEYECGAGDPFDDDVSFEAGDTLELWVQYGNRESGTVSWAFLVGSDGATAFHPTVIEGYQYGGDAV